ncbi:hypothetical protein MCOR02_003931 [Pyricularia oryzae]|nr:hypothetical protein MCOR01_005752 [Pyricularia oryzae]KAH9434966.1 hypothetical protein MCOR02_003931 [Pyricularia oryzae]KAI6528642.1 hypothetical protein MCOR16_005303 [Pyricularia oryzae]
MCVSRFETNNCQGKTAGRPLYELGATNSAALVLQDFATRLQCLGLLGRGEQMQQKKEVLMIQKKEH